VIQILDDSIQYHPAILQAMRTFSDSGPWSGTIEERKAKFQRLNRELAAACGIRPPELVVGDLGGGSSGGSHYLPVFHRIVLTGRLSVVTFLHEFAHALKRNEWQACRWSVNLFRRAFPQQFSRLVYRGHVLVRPEDVSPTYSRFRHQG